jgi:hypothetical protein
MVRITPTVLSGTLLVCAIIGCANFVETQAISHFTAALEKGDLDKLKETTSDSFEQKALRSKEATDALKVLNLHPEEKLIIVKVKDVADPEKKVTVKKVEVTTGKTHRKMQYNLVRDQQSGKWVVDDILIKQQNRKDVTAVKSVTEQMDLLLVVQDFLVAWHSGKGAGVAAVTTPTFGKLLGELPASHLERLTKKVAGERLRPDEFRPEATIDGNDAIVKLQRNKGVLILTMKQTNKGWRVADVAVESRQDKDHLTSARKTATAVRTVVDFLKAYKSDDKTALKPIVAARFYDECLKVADLKVIPLPAPEVLGDKDVVKTHDKGAEYVLQRKNETVKISLSETDGSTTPGFVVDDVTIFDSKEEKRLSALFTAQAKMQLFMQAILKGNLILVKKNSTADFRAKIWNRLGPVSLAEILPPEIEMEPPVVNGTDFRGSMIRIHVHQGSRELTYVMRDWSGEVTVDDILMPVMDRPSSMKETMQALLPIRLLAAALREASIATNGHDRPIQTLKSVTSNDFNRVVWSQTAQIPEGAFSSLPHFSAKLSSITDTPTGQTVVFGDERFGAKIELCREREVLVVDRVWLVSGSPDEAPDLKSLLKTQLVKRGPRDAAVDPMSAEPIATEPTRTAGAFGSQLTPAADGSPASAESEPTQSDVPRKAAFRPATRD